ncbi:hypothetical protein ACFC1V_34875, partial [Streptomyces sp. NPDC056069]
VLSGVDGSCGIAVRGRPESVLTSDNSENTTDHEGPCQPRAWVPADTEVGRERSIKIAPRTRPEPVLRLTTISS